MTHQDTQPLINDANWVREVWQVREILHIMQPRVGLVKQVDLAACIEGRFRIRARPLRANPAHVPLEGFQVEQMISHMLLARWRRLAAHRLCRAVDPRAIAEQGLV